MDPPSSSKGIWKQHFQAIKEEKSAKRSSRIRFMLFGLSVLALLTRLLGLTNPNQVVFDEVHFGKFAGHYLRGRYFFDVNPPLGKMIIAAVGHVAGYRGNFPFKRIGETFTPSVPLFALRLSSAIPGVLLVLLVFLIMIKLGHNEMAALLSATMVLFDNAITVQSRFILLDGILLFWIFGAIFCWVSFRKARAKPFSLSWWGFLLGTGVCLSCAVSTKFVGLFAVALIGVETLLDLWELLEWKKHISILQFAKHFVARFLCLVVVPVALYLGVFYLHFLILHKSGPGDIIMSPSFQATLDRNPISFSPRTIAYGSLIVLRHDNTFQYLHSSRDQYPAIIHGHMSSKGQRMSTSDVNSAGSWWLVLPMDETMEFQDRAIFVNNGDIIRLQHFETGAFLFAHDLASPITPGNVEVAADSPSIQMQKAQKNGIHWKLELLRATPDQKFQVLSNSFRLQHTETGAYLSCHVSKDLPEQFDISASKDHTDDSHWTVESHLNRYLTQFIEFAPPATFWEKFYETHQKMYLHNKHLSVPHTYESTPITWPFLVKGIRYWTGTQNNQIFLLGNPFVWGTAFYCGIITFVALWLTTLFTEHRGHRDFDKDARSRFRYSGTFFFVAWAVHYAPFFFMERTLYLHHYLPALIFSILLTGVVFDFICDAIGDPDAQTYTTLVLVGLFMVGYYYFSPLTFANPVTPNDIQSLQWFQTWNFKLPSP